MKDAYFISIRPKEELLKPFVHTYYVQENLSESFEQRIEYYPNFVTTLNIYAESKVTWSEHQRVHQYAKGSDYTCLLVGKFDRSREIIHRGPLRKISIVFTPLGLNQFIRVQLSELVADHFAGFDHFGRPFERLFCDLFGIADMESKRDLLDHFLLSLLEPLNNPILSMAVNEIHHCQGNLKAAELAEKLDVHRRTLLRLFQKHLSYSIKEYATVVKFRYALIDYQERKRKMRLTELAYKSGYYDQADLIHQFRKLTGQKPSHFFKHIQSVNQEVYWKLR